MTIHSKFGFLVTRLRRGIRLFPIFATLLVSSCKGTINIDPSFSGGSYSKVSSLSIVAGNNQSGTVNTDLAVPFTVVVKDGSGLPVEGEIIEWTIASGGGAVSNEVSRTAGNGTAAVNFRLPGASGTQSIVAKIRNSSPTLAVTFSSSTTPVPNTMTLTLSSGNATAGVPISATLRISDQFGNIRSDYLGIVNLSTSDPQASLPASYSFTSGASSNFDNGSHTFTITYRTAGTYTLTFRDFETGLTQSAAIQVTAATANRLAFVSNIPSGSQPRAGNALPAMVVKALDAYGNTDTSFAQDITVSAEDQSQLAYPVFGSSNFSASNGFFNISGLQIQKTGSQIFLKLAAGALPILNSSPFDILPGNATSLSIASGGSQSGKVGTNLAQPIVAHLSDAFGNAIPSAAIAWSVSAGSLSAASIVTNASGNSSNQLTLPPTAGLISGQVAYGTLISSFSVTADPDVPASVAIVSGNNQQNVVGNTLASPLLVEVRDQYSNAIPGVTIDWSITSGSGTLGSASSITSGSAGAGFGRTSTTFTLPTTAASISIEAKVNLSSPAISNSFSVVATPGAATSFVIFSGDAQSGPVGTSLASPLVAKVSDTYGNPISGATIDWSVTAGSAILNSAQSTTGANGRASNTVQLPNSTGTQSIRATLAGSALSPVVFAATADPTNAIGSLVVSVPANASAGQQVVANLLVRDQFGNTKTNFSGSVSISSTDPNFSVNGGSPYIFTTGVGGDNGSHDFLVTLETAGLQGITFAVASGPTQSANVTVAAAPATMLLWTTDVSSPSIAAGSPLASVTVRAVDAYGNTDKAYTSTISLILNPNPGSASIIGGSYSASAVQGSVSFTGLSFDKAGVGYKLAASGGLASNGLNPTGASSNAFNIVAGAPTQMSIANGAGQSGAAGTALAGSLQVLLADAYLNPVANAPVVWASTSGGSFAPSNATNTDASGVASVTYTLPTLAGALSVSATYYGSTNLSQNFPLEADAGAPARLTITSGDAQSGAAGSNLSSLVVTVGDLYDNPVQGAQIDWTSANGVKFSGASSGQSSSAVNGQANIIPSLPTLAGAVSVVATINGSNPVVSTTFNLTGYSGTPASISVVSGDAQSGYVSNQITNPLVVVVKDGNNNPVPNTQVNWTATAGTPLSSSASTDENGRASTDFLLPNTTGAITVTATVNSTALNTTFAVNATPAATLGSVTATASASIVAGQVLNVVVVARDTLGNVKSDFTGSIALTSNDPLVDFGLGGPTSYTYTTGAGGDNGSHLFTITLKTKGSANITFDAGSGIIATITPTVTPAMATKLMLVADLPSASFVSAATLPSLSVQALDPYNNIDTNFTRPITVSLNPNPGSATLAGTSTSITAVAGQATFSGLSIAKAAGGNRLAFNATNALSAALTTVSTMLFDITPGPVTSVVTVAGYTSLSTVNSSVGTLSVQAFDASSNPVPNITIAWTSNAGGTFSATSSTTNASGTASTSFTLPTVSGNVVVSATYYGSSTYATTFPLIARAGPAQSFTVAGYTSPSTAGIQRSATVTARDQYGNVAHNYTGTVRFTSNDPAAVVPADSTLTASTGTFNFTLKTAGTRAITATDTVTGSITGSQTGITIGNASATVLLVSGFPSTPTAGVSGSVTVTARDAFGNVDTDYAGTVHFTSTDGQATLPADSTLSSGVGNFLVTLKTAGARSISAADTVSGINGSQSSITVGYAPASVLVVSGFPGTISAGTASSVTVTAKDAFGNVDTGYAGTVHLTSNDGAAMLGADNTLSSGSRSFSVTLKTFGTRSITATDTVSATITGSQTGISVNAGTATNLLVSGYPSTPSAGSSASITVTARDAYGNTASSYGGTVHFTSSDGQSILPANSTLSAGTGSFSVTLKTAGLQSITATDTVSSGINGAQSGIAVAPLAATKFVVAGFPSSIITYAGGSVIVTAQDVYDNTATAYAGTLHFTSTDGQATLPADTTLTSGTGTFIVTFKTPGTHSITATDTVNGTVTGLQTGIIVSPASAATFVVSGFSATPTAGVGGTVTVTAKDIYGATATGYTGTVHLTSSDPQAVLGADAGLTNGVGTFAVTLKTAGTQSVTAVDTLAAGITGSQTGIAVSPAALNKAVYTTLPIANLQTSMPFNPVVQAEDQYGNFISGVRSASLAVYTNAGCTTPVGSGTLSGSTGNTNAGGQWAPSGVKYSGVGSFYLGATITGASVVACSAFTTTAAVPSLANSTVSATPGSAVPGSGAVAALVIVRDSGANPIQGISVSISSSRGATDSASGTQLTDASGQASFSITSSTYGRAVITATVASTQLSNTPTIYFLQALPIADYTAPMAQSNLSSGTNSPATSTWMNRTGNVSYDGYLSGFAYTTASGWAGNGGSAAVSDPYQLKFDGSTAANVDFAQSANAGGLVEAFVRMPASIPVTSRKKVILTNADSSGNGFTLRYSGLGATQIAASQPLPLELVSGTQSYADLVFADSPVAYWPSPSTDFKDQQNSYHLNTSGTFGRIIERFGAPPQTDYVYPRVLGGTTRRFLSGGYSYTSSNVPSATNLSVETWTRLADLTAGDHRYRTCAPGDPQYANYWRTCATRGKSGDAAPALIMAKRDSSTGLQWALYWSNGKLVWTIGSNTLTSNASPAINTWHHVVVTQTSDGVATLYIDGSQDIQTTFSSFTMTNSSSPIYIGYDSNLSGSAAYAMGNINHVAVYSSALNSTQVSTHYAGRSSGSCELGNLPQVSSWNYISVWPAGTKLIRAAVTTKTATSTSDQICDIRVPSVGGASTSFNASNANLVFGSNSNKNGNFFDGALGELRVFPYTSSMNLVSTSQCSVYGDYYSGSTALGNVAYPNLATCQAENPAGDPSKYIDPCYSGYLAGMTSGYYGWNNGSTAYANQAACQAANFFNGYSQHYNAEKSTYP